MRLIIDQFGRKRGQKKHKDVDYKLLYEFFQNHFVAHEQSPAVFVQYIRMLCTGWFILVESVPFQCMMKKKFTGLSALIHKFIHFFRELVINWKLWEEIWKHNITQYNFICTCMIQQRSKLNIRWTNFWQPTIHVQQNIFEEKFVAQIFTLLLAPFASKFFNYSRHSESLKNAWTSTKWLVWKENVVDFEVS